MFIDAHCHPFDLSFHLPQIEEECRKAPVIALTSACDLEEFEFCERLAQKAEAENATRIFPCLGIHPQMKGEGKRDRLRGDSPKGSKKDAINSETTLNLDFPITSSLLPYKSPDPCYSYSHLDLLEKLASQSRLSAIGECGFDLFNDEYKATEKWQDEVFAAQMEIALRYDLPVVIHARRAMHKIFAVTNTLKKCKAVIFHSWPGTPDEGQAFLRRGVNAYFSFSSIILNGHKKAISSCALLPANRLLTETDAPYQPPKGAAFSTWNDLPRIVEAIANLRNSSAPEIESLIESNFNNIFNRI